MSVRRVLFVTSNGVGAGHLTRSMAIARRLPKGLTPLFFTLSEALPVVETQGYFAEYFPSRQVGRQFGEDSALWDKRFARRLTEVLDLYDPSAIVFDGTLPYLGLVQNMWRSPERAFAWCRRPLWKPGKSDANLVYAPAFQLIIEPGDFADRQDRGPTSRRRAEASCVGPVLLYDSSELLDRRAAERELGLRGRRVNALVSLGAGVLNDTRGAVQTIIEALRADPRVQIAIARSSLSGTVLKETRGVVALDRYPLSPYLRAFDLAVTASGYNSFHEILQAGIPSLQIPNVETKVDDQLARARTAADQGLALLWTPGSTRLEDSVATLLEDGVREDMAYRLRRVKITNGARAAARHVSKLVETVA